MSPASYSAVQVNKEIFNKIAEIIRKDMKLRNELGYKSVSDIVNSFLKAFIKNPIPKYNLIASGKSIDALRDELDSVTNEMQEMQLKMENMAIKLNNLENIA